MLNITKAQATKGLTVPNLFCMSHSSFCMDTGHFLINWLSRLYRTRGPGMPRLITDDCIANQMAELIRRLVYLSNAILISDHAVKR